MLISRRTPPGCPDGPRVGQFTEVPHLTLLFRLASGLEHIFYDSSNLQENTPAGYPHRLESCVGEPEMDEPQGGNNFLLSRVHESDPDSWNQSNGRVRVLGPKWKVMARGTTGAVGTEAK